MRMFGGGEFIDVVLEPHLDPRYYGVWDGTIHVGETVFLEMLLSQTWPEWANRVWWETT